MRHFAILLTVLLAYGAPPMVPHGQAKKAKPVTAPPTPLGVNQTGTVTIKRKLKALSEATVTQGTADPNSPYYAKVGTFPSVDTAGKTNIGVYIQWNNWPQGMPYQIDKTTNMVTWDKFVVSGGDAGRMLAIFDLDEIAIYKIRYPFNFTPPQ